MKNLLIFFLSGGLSFILQSQTILSFSETLISSAYFTSDIKIDDVNNDSRPDVVGTSWSTGGTMVHLANAGGGFGPLSGYSGISRGKFLALIDYDSDGYKDMMISSCPTNSSYPSYIAVLKGSASGFATPLAYSMTASGERILQAADVSGDGNLDLIAAEYKNNATGAGSSRILVFGIPGNGTLQYPTIYPLAAPPTDFIVSDVNGDGMLDVVACSFQMSQVIVMLNTGASLGAAQYINVCTNPIGVCTGDFDNDGNNDIAVGNSSGVYTILMGTGGGLFNSLGNALLYNTADYPVAADFNGDGFVDLAFGSDEYTPGDGIEIALGNGNGSFTSQGQLTYFGVSHKLHVVDFNNDGKPDIVGNSDNSLILLSNTSTSVSTTGIKNHNLTPSVKIFNNNGHCTIMSSKNCDIEISDINGKIILKQSETDKVQISENDMPSGIYFCKFIYPEGIQCKKILIGTP